MYRKKRLIPLSVPLINGNEWKYIKKCLDSGWVSSAGASVKKFENMICRYVKAKYAVSCVNGTAGLFMALKLSGVGKNEEVIVPTLTFIAPVNAVKYLAAEPVFMDCDDHMNMDPDKLNEFCRRECIITRGGLLRNKKSGRIIRAVVPVHIFGNPCNMEKIMEVAVKFKLKVIEDATESLGAYYTAGVYRNRFTGTIGDFGVYSFNGNKIITTGGGGMIIARKGNLADRLRYLTSQAKDDALSSVHNEIGYNFRLTNLQAALGLAQLERIDSFIKIKKRNYELYKEKLEGIHGIGLMSVPGGTSPNYWFYSLIIDKEKYGLDRQGLMLYLSKMGIETRPVWYLNHAQKPYLKNQSYRIKKAPRFWERVLSLPCSSGLTGIEIERLSAAIKKLSR